ncbi:MAG: outer membrane beta-barrel protein [Verrucomicrobiales bacterium]|nr:outer membrane beta-barrel protein [Verrucomicrobiales bacterium]
MIVGLAPLTASGQISSQPSRSSALLEDLRAHAKASQAERSAVEASESAVADDSTGEIESLPANDAAEIARNQAIAESLGGDQSNGVDPSRSFDRVYQQRLASRGSFGAGSGFSAGAADRSGTDSYYGYFQPPRSSYFPTSIRPEDRNFSLGPMDVRMGARAYAEYNDNIREGSSSNRIEDVVVGTMIDIGGTWQLTENNRIDLNLGLGIERYLQHQADIATSNDEFNLIVTPGSAFSYDLFLGNLLINIHDRLSVQNRGRDDFTLDDLELLSQWTNSAGVSAYLPLNEQVDISLNYDYTTTRSLEDSYDFLDRNSHQISGATSYSPEQIWRIGLESTASFNRYVNPPQHDSNFYSAGLFFESPISEFTNFRIDGGNQISDFSDTGVNPSSGKDGDYYGSLAIDNTLNDFYSHSLSLGHETTQGVLSDTSTYDYVRYSFNLALKQNQSLSGDVNYRAEEEAGGSFQEDSTSYGCSLRYRVSLSESLTAGLGGNYTTTDRDDTSRNYDRWSASLSLDYTLSEKLQLGLAYDLTRANTETGAEDYDQNRITLDLSYRF